MLVGFHISAVVFLGASGDTLGDSSLCYSPFVSMPSSSLTKGITSQMRVLMSSSAGKSLKTDHFIRILRFWRASSMRILIKPW